MLLSLLQATALKPRPWTHVCNFLGLQSLLASTLPMMGPLPNARKFARPMQQLADKSLQQLLTGLLLMAFWLFQLLRQLLDSSISTHLLWCTHSLAKPGLIRAPGQALNQNAASFSHSLHQRSCRAPMQGLPRALGQALDGNRPLEGN